MKPRKVYLNKKFHLWFLLLFCHLYNFSKVWNLPTYSVPIPETPKYPIDYKEPPLIDDREPIEINVKKATR